MTELEMFKKLFSECSIWRGGCDSVVEDSKFPVLPIHIAVKLKNGGHSYSDLNLVFDKDGRWTDTVKA
jgi:hypothetical protein